MNYVWKKSHVKKKNKIFQGFRVFEYALWQKTEPGIAGNHQKAFEIKKAPSVNFSPLLENC